MSDIEKNPETAASSSLSGEDFSGLLTVVTEARRAIECGNFDPQTFYSLSGNALREIGEALREQESLQPYRDLAIAGNGAAVPEEGVLEVDGNARVSGCKSGAYVQAWIWVDNP